MLRREVAPRGEQPESCNYEKVTPFLGSSRDDPFTGFFRWRTTTSNEHESLFKFDHTFNSRYANGELSVSDTVHFTPTYETCEAQHNTLMARQAKTKEALLSLDHLKNQEALDETLAVFKPYQKAKITYDRMGCKHNSASAAIMPVDIKDQ